jgi:hypothetical protein
LNQDNPNGNIFALRPGDCFFQSFDNPSAHTGDFLLASLGGKPFFLSPRIAHCPSATSFPGRRQLFPPVDVESTKRYHMRIARWFFRYPGDLIQGERARGDFNVLIAVRVPLKPLLIETAFHWHLTEGKPKSVTPQFRA